MERRAGWGEKGIQQRNESNKDGVRTGYPDHLDYEGQYRVLVSLAGTRTRVCREFFCCSAHTLFHVGTGPQLRTE